VIVLALIAATQLAIEGFNAPRVLTLGALSEPLFKGHFLRERGPTRFVVDSLSAASPLHGAGVVPGDLLRWNEPLGRWYNVAAGETATLTVIHGGASREIEVTMPAARALPRHQVAIYVMDFLGRVVALCIGVFIGLRRADLTAFRGFAAAGLLSAIPFPYSAPAGSHIESLDFIGSFARDLAIGALVFFAVNYPDDKPVGWRALLKRYYPWFFGLLVTAEVGYFARLYAGHFEPLAGWFFRVTSIGLPLLFLATIILAWRQARGESKIRLQWILGTLGTVISAVLIETLNSLIGEPIEPTDVGLVLTAAELAGIIGIVYAILRHRIFDFGFAVNRTLVFAIVGAILLGAFQIAHAIVGEFLHFDDKNKTIVLSAILAGTIYLSFSQLKKVVEKVVDRLFFRAWAMRDEALRRFVKEAQHASDADALGASFVAALDRFTQGATSALFRRSAIGDFERVAGTLLDAPETVGANDAVALAMLAHDKAILIRDYPSALRAALALPMAHRGELLGFAVVGSKPGGDPYRPDEVDALGFAAHQVGLDFYALKLERLSRQIAAERRTSETLRAQLDIAIEMAKSRPAPGTS
jgi:GAF domain-containing protein